MIWCYTEPEAVSASAVYPGNDMVDISLGKSSGAGFFSRSLYDQAVNNLLYLRRGTTPGFMSDVLLQPFSDGYFLAQAVN